MATTPITEAIEKLRKAIYDALSPLAAPRGVYWLQAAQGVALPFVVVQSQDGGGKALTHLGDYAWEGLVTIKALATSQSAAATLLAAVLPGMASLASTGYSFSVEHERPIVIPPDTEGTWTAAALYRVGIYKP